MKNKRMDKEKVDAIRRAKKEARAFAWFLHRVPVKLTFTLWNLQGALRGGALGVPSEQTYAQHLQHALESGFIERVAGEPDTYRRIWPRRSSWYSYWRLTDELVSKAAYAEVGAEWLP